MRCIVCLQSDPSCGFSREHVFPDGVGGTLTTDRVCKNCNDILGQTVDVHLTNHTLIELARLHLNLRGKKGRLPQPLERATLEDRPHQKVRYTIDPTKAGPQKIYMLPSVRREDLNDGTSHLHVTVDADDGDKLVEIVNRALSRAGVPPLAREEIEERKRPLRTERPPLTINLTIDVSHYRRGLVKIAYELAFLWLGDRYLDDPTAAIMRKLMLDTEMPFDIGSKYKLRGDIPFISRELILPFWRDEPHTLIGAALRRGESDIGIYVRVLDTFDAFLVVTSNAREYPEFDQKFLSVDAVTGRIRRSSFEEEAMRIAMKSTRQNVGVAP